MNKNVLILGGLLLTLPQAMKAYTYMEFKTTDGTTQTINAKNLVLTVSDNNLLADNGTDRLTLPLSSLSSMQMTDKTGVTDVMPALDSTVTVYTLNGVEIGKFDSLKKAYNALESGIYLVKDNEGSTTKIVIER